jgi:hypothetical protein
MCIHDTNFSYKDPLPSNNISYANNSLKKYDASYLVPNNSYQFFFLIKKYFNYFLIL